MYAKWMKLGREMTMLAWEAQTVVGLRLAKIALGGAAAERESKLMVAEKVKAAMETMGHVATGGTARSVVRHYRRKVRANRARLTG